jgi:hypothetical protein
MSLDEALAVHGYLRDNVEHGDDAGREARREAWRIICEYANEVIADLPARRQADEAARADHRSPQTTGDSA